MRRAVKACLGASSRPNRAVFALLLFFCFLSNSTTLCGMRGLLRLLLLAALSAAAVCSDEEAAAPAAQAPVEGSAKADESSRAQAIKEALANAKLPEWLDVKAQQKALCCSLATPGYEKQLLNCVRRNGPMPAGVTAQEESDGYDQEEGKRIRQKKAFDGSGRILVLMEVRKGACQPRITALAHCW